MTTKEWRKKLEKVPLRDLFRMRDGIALLDGVEVWRQEYGWTGVSILEMIVQDEIKRRLGGAYAITDKEPDIIRADAGLTEDQKVLIGLTLDES